MLRNGMGGQDFSEIHMAYSTSTANGNSIVGEFSHTEVDCGGNRETASAYLMRGTGLNGTVDEAKTPIPQMERVWTAAWRLRGPLKRGIPSGTFCF